MTTTVTATASTAVRLPAARIGRHRSASPALSLDARLAATEALLTVRLDAAALAVDMAVAVLGVPDVDEFLEPLPLSDPPGEFPPMPDPTPAGPAPVARVLTTAAHILKARGWTTGQLRDPAGALCLAAAVREAALQLGCGAAEEGDALDRLLTYVRREFNAPDATIPSINDAALRDQDHAVRILGSAARTL